MIEAPALTASKLVWVPLNPSDAFCEAVVEAYEALTRTGSYHPTPDLVWERLSTDARMEGTLTALLAWDTDPAKRTKSYAATIERLIEQRKCNYLQMTDYPDGQPRIEEEIPF